MTAPSAYYYCELKKISALSGNANPHLFMVATSLRHYKSKSTVSIQSLVAGENILSNIVWKAIVGKNSSI